ncbi:MULTISPECIES: single-stranded DNA-binding protein [Sphingobacterium]|uniref:single-stranded DNA-binding protein n=1 Tax=Sphingobacterium TaxID=28453 RepID=UPI00257C5868|nr:MULTISPECIES: single-stranded DNA-binding protein [Sphingobacterium]
MKTSVNKVTLRGHLGKDPEVKQLATDRSVARVSLATTEGYKKSDGEWVNETQWHSLVFWGDQASFAELNLKKGMLVEIEGKLTYRSFKENDNTKFITEVVVRTAREIKEAEPEQPIIEE